MTTKVKQVQKQKPLRIDLDKIWNPHPEIIRAYKDGNALDLSFELGHTERSQYNSPAYNNEARLFKSAEAGKKGIKHKITSIHRVRKGVKEYAYFYEDF